jgi:hypothetical protein
MTVADTLNYSRETIRHGCSPTIAGKYGGFEFHADKIRQTLEVMFADGYSGFEFQTM